MTPTTLTLPALLDAGLMVPSLTAAKTVWRCTAWSVEGELARRRLESAVATWTPGEALQWAVAQARDEAGQAFPPGELEAWAWTVAPMVGVP